MTDISDIIKQRFNKSENLKKLTERLSDMPTQTLDTDNTQKISGVNIHTGHRERLRHKFIESGFVGFHDYEIIELILFQAIPRRDVKQIAKNLLKTFGTIENIFNANPNQIERIKGCGENVAFILRLFYQTSLVISREQLNTAPLLAKWTELSNYLRLRMGYLTHEEFHILFLNAKSYLISDMKIFRGTVDKVGIYPREILKHALECEAVSIVLAHNHPSGDATPSHEDIQLTYAIIKAAQLMNINVVDHIIIGKYSINSFRNLNLL